jgi:HipA N-terminal domain
MMKTPGSLVVWMNGLRVGEWSEGRGGRDLFRYDDAWVAHPAARALSLSLPLAPGNAPHAGPRVRNYFDNLLPDSDAIRRRVRARFAVGSTNAFDLLAAVGRDCVGAVQLLPPDEEPGEIDRIDADPLKEADVEEAIADALSGSRLTRGEERDEFRISIAGAQEKTALLRYENRWWRPRGATPTTHILKLPLGLVGNLRADMADSVENEWLCAQLLRELGLDVANCEIAEFGRFRVLVVERFDRAWQDDGGWIARLPQEDFCQALGVPGVLKYESDGGPGMRDIFRVLEGGSRPRADKAMFLRAQIAFWLLAATDGHAKNFSLFLERGGGYRMTPLYDVLSAWPIIGRGANQLDIHKARLAMAVRSKNPHWKIREIEPRHWDEVARAAGLGDAKAVRGELAKMAGPAVKKCAAKLPKGFPSRVSDKIFEGLLAGAKRLAD